MITLHHCHEARSMRTLWLLHEMGLDFDLRIYPFGKALRAPEYLAIHPLGRVPCLEEDGLVLFETGAITEYLVEKYPEKGLGRLPGAAERAHWLQWLHYAETVAVHGATLTQQHIVIYEDRDRSPFVMKLERRRLEKALEVLDTHLADGREYLLESGFSAIDTNVGYSVYVARHFTPLQVFPHLAAYYNRLSARPAFAKSLPETPALFRQPFYDLRDDLAS
ncbi:MAG: glutathione S-transferase family protein [Nitratireductor sp.]|nr:glutathione S-transferase family protein [Nitratireductor sp.]